MYKQRRDYFCRLLCEKLDGHLDFDIPDGGMALWLRFSRPLDPEKFCRGLIENGLFINTDSFYEIEPDKYALRVGFASLDEKEIKQATDIFAKVLLTM